MAFFFFSFLFQQNEISVLIWVVCHWYIGAIWDAQAALLNTAHNFSGHWKKYFVLDSWSIQSTPKTFCLCPLVQLTQSGAEPAVSRAFMEWAAEGVVISCSSLRPESKIILHTFPEDKGFDCSQISLEPLFQSAPLSKILVFFRIYTHTYILHVPYQVLLSSSEVNTLLNTYKPI